MEKNTKIKIVGGAAAALVLAVAVGAAGAVAASRVFDAGEESRAAVIEDAASQLGVEPDELADALNDALKNQIDAAVEAGRLTEEQGEELKERIDSRETPLVLGGFGREGFGLGHHRHLGHLEAAASYLGLSEVELRDRLSDGTTLAEIAADESKTVDGLVQAMVEAAEATLDKAVADGRLTEERAEELKQDLDARVTDLVNGELRGHRFHPRGGFGRDFGFRGPPGFRGSRD